MSELIIKKRQAVFVFRVEDIVYMEKNLRKIRLHAKMCGCEKYEQIEFYGRFSEIISQLDDTEKKLIELRYFKNLTQSRTADILGMTQVQVSRKEKKLLLKMREKLME